MNIEYLPNINPYEKEKWEIYFKTTSLYESIKNDFDYIDFSHFVENSSLGYSQADIEHKHKLTPRQRQGTSSFSATIFYYIDYLIKDDPQIIYDLGCGWNIFKRYIPQIHGIDWVSDYSDSVGFIDGKFIYEHQKYYKHVMSINALHYKPLNSIKQIVSDFISLLQDGGKGLLTLNTARMTKINMHNPTAIENFVRKELCEFKDFFEVFDVNMSVKDAYLDGNVRMILTK